MTNLTIQDIVQIITVISLLLGFLGGAVAWAHAIWKKIASLHKILTIIQLEFAKNGVNSLRESLNQISLNQSNILSNRHVLYSYIDRQYSSPMLVVDRSGRCTWANKAYLELTNRKLPDVLDSNWENTVSLEDRDNVREEWYNNCEEGRSFEITYRLNNKELENNIVRCIVYGGTNTGYVAFFEKSSGSTKAAP